MSGASANLLWHVHQLVEVHRIGSLSDHQLLERFAAERDEAAFSLLVRRHGPMVLGVCRRVLGHEQDAEDVFQAAFQILARRAGAIRQADVGGFLYRVAYHLAIRARGDSSKRRRREQRAETSAAPDLMTEVTWREVRQVVDEELQRLSEALRSALVLCYLEGKSLEEAARLLGWSKSTLRRRLNHGRELLRRRLLARGLAPMAALTASLFAEETAAAMPAMLAGATVRAAVSGTASPAVAALVEAGGALVSAGKAKIATVILLAASVLSGAGVYFLASPQRQQGQPLLALRAGGENSDAPPSVKRDGATALEIQGRVLDPEGKPKTGAKLLLLSSKGKITSLGVSAADGTFTVAVPKETTKHWDHWLIAQSDGAGLDFLDLYQFKNKKPVELRLVKDNAIRGRVVNTEGKPIRGVRVAVEQIEIYRDNSLDTFRAAWIKLYAGGAGSGLDRQIYSGAGALFATTTGADGRFVVHGMGAERTIRLRLRGAGIADTSVWVANRAGLDPKPFNQAVLDHVSKGHLNYRWSLLSGPDVSVIAEAEKVIRGVVTDADTGKEVSGVMVRLTRDSDELIHYPPEAKTDAQGRCEIHGVRKTKRYLLAIDDNKATGHLPSQVWAEDTVAHQPVHADIKIKKGVIVTGKIIDGATGEALPGFVMGSVLRGNSYAKDYPKFDELWNMNPYDSYDRTDAEHAFRIVAIPGPILLMGKTEGINRAIYKYVGGDPKRPQYFTEAGDGYYGYNRMAPLQGIWNKVLEIKPGVAVVKKDIVLEREKILAEVQVQDADGKPLPGSWAATNDRKRGISFAPHSNQKESSSWSIYGEASDKPLRIVFYQADRKLAGTLTLKGDEKQPVIVKLGPAGAIKGRLLDADGKPLADMVVELRYRDRAAQNIHVYHIENNDERGPILTDVTGAFAFDHVIPEMAFELSFRQSKRRSKYDAITAIPAIQVKPGEYRDLGTIKLKRAPEKADE
jgi:RNA polymerase sigma factor (sigma-70 family)